jgi:hypothetical protein
MIPRDAQRCTYPGADKRFRYCPLYRERIVIVAQKGHK